MKKVTTILFDFDGTIADSLMTVVDALNGLSADFGFKKITKSNVQKMRNTTLKEVLKELNISIFKVPFLLKKFKSQSGSRYESVKLFPNIKPVLLSLKQSGYKLGVLTSNSEQIVRSFLEKNELQVFDYIDSDSSLFGKDKVLVRVLNRHKIKVKDLIYVGDEVRDIEACRKIKVPIVSVTWGYNSRSVLEKNQPDFIADDPAMLQQLLKKLA